MADNATQDNLDDFEETPGYRAPAQKSLNEIQNMDAEDESLVKYKQQLLAGAGAVKDEGGGNVVVKSLSMRIEGRDDVVVDLTGDISKLKEKPIVIKEGTDYRVAITFRVQREIVSGLRYLQAFYRKGIRVDKAALMVGSYGPKDEAHVYVTPVDQAPSGMLARGTYVVKSRFTDDDKNDILAWEWCIDIKKDWK